MIKDHDHLIKLILVGSSGVGKTCILTQFADNKFSQTYLTTIGVDFRFKTIKNDGKSIKYQIWDTAGQERFRTITSAYYKGADGIIMVYDVTDPLSLQEIANYWIPEAYNYCDRGIQVLLLGNKSDCPSKIVAGKIEEIVGKYGFTHALVSAKTDTNIHDSIKDLGTRIITKKATKKSQILAISGTSSSNMNHSGKQASGNDRQKDREGTGRNGNGIQIGGSSKEYSVGYKKGCC